MVEYFGVFFNEIESYKILKNENKALEKKAKNFHCTFCYKPKRFDEFNKIVGKETLIKLTGYSCDGKNSGFEIELSKNIKNYFQNFDENRKIKTPHITVSLSKDAKAVNTANLKFKKLEEPILIKGKFGYFIREQNNSYISFKKVKINELSN